MDAGIAQSSRVLPPNPLPASWLGRPDAPVARPDWAVIAVLTATQQRNLLAQIAYDFSGWDYKKIGANNELGRYQFNVQTLESYGLLTPGSYVSYGADAVNYQHCWRAPASTYADYLSDVANINDFLINTSAQEFLAYQRLVDLYNSSLRIGAIRKNDSADVVVGMLYTAWVLSPGTAPTKNNTTGTGAYAWRNYNIGTGNVVYTSGRYSATVLSTSLANNTLPTYADQQSATVAETAGTINSGGLTVATLGSLTQGITNAAQVQQQIQAQASNIVGGVVSSAANGLIGGLAAGLGQNGGASINLIAAAIQNPRTAQAAVTNMAATYAMQQVGSFVTELTQPLTNNRFTADRFFRDQVGDLTNNKIQQYAIDKLDILNALNLTTGEFTGNI